MLRPIVMCTLALLILTGCHTSNHYADSVEAYVNASTQVDLGMSAAEVDRILAPSQHQLSNLVRKRDERYLDGDTIVLIRYYRSGWQSDGRLTNDEYTPYLFRDDALISIGWQLMRSAML